MTDAQPGAEPDQPRRTLAPWLLAAGYFVVFFAAMTLGGLLFLLGGITIVLIPGSLPTWVDVAYVAFGIVGSVAIAVVAANGAFRLAGRRGEADSAVPRTRVLGWVAGISGTVLASVLSAVLGAALMNWLKL